MPPSAELLSSSVSPLASPPPFLQPHHGQGSFRHLPKMPGHTRQGDGLGRGRMAEPCGHQGHLMHGGTRGDLRAAPRCAAAHLDKSLSLFFASLIRRGRSKHKHSRNDAQECPFLTNPGFLSLSPSHIPAHLLQALPFLPPHSSALLCQ